MRLRVNQDGLVIPKELLNNAEEFEIRQEKNIKHEIVFHAFVFKNSCASVREKFVFIRGEKNTPQAFLPRMYTNYEPRKTRKL